MTAPEDHDLLAFLMHGLQAERVPVEVGRDVDIFHGHVRHCVLVAKHALISLVRLRMAVGGSLLTELTCLP